MMKRINWKDVAARTVKTFVAVFLGSLCVNVDLQGVDSKALARALFATLLSAVSAGITAVWNVLLEIFRDQINEGIDKIFGRIGDDGLTPVPGADEVFTVEDVEPDPDTLEEAEPGEII